MKASESYLQEKLNKDLFDHLDEEEAKVYARLVSLEDRIELLENINTSDGYTYERILNSKKSLKSEYDQLKKELGL